MYFVSFFFFKQKTAYEMRISDWSSDVCSSDLPEEPQLLERQPADDERRAGAARRVDRGVGHGDRNQVDQGERKSDRDRRETRRRAAVGRSHEERKRVG